MTVPMTAVRTGAARRVLPYGVPDGALRLFCLPHAGASASVFRPWIGRLPGVAVCPLQPPGREGRLAEPQHERMEPLADEFARAVRQVLDGGSQPYAVYGHSLGALVGYEVVRRIRDLGGPAPVHLFVSGCGAPDRSAETGPRVSTMSDAQIAALMSRLGGTPPGLLAEPSLLRMFLPPFRADFVVKENYAYRPGRPLAVPVTALAATADPRVGPGDMEAWAGHTAGPFRLHTLTGGHFAVLEQAAVTHRHIAEALRGGIAC
ncbi:thioesterase domain-containing protein [Micromonospora sp. WMMD1102]|uniref:thioesterase II family protein n=1 Tax=Micromonospora sp. WMMD1102 TaxID=3016105 RepID=UPI002415275D|nr:thioesterase domain-containing protein [Micromonospora sp. WMMD1102]MDG4785097.1 thioesterase domain-containing protein [Micromonospora sp. WMMD1102]